EPVPLPRHRPALKADKAGKAASKPGHQAAPLSIAPAAASASSLAAVPGNAALLAPLVQAPILAAPPAPGAPFASAPTSTTSPMDLSAVKQAIDLVRKNRQDEATGVEAAIADPLARKLVEWVILRSEDG